MDAAPELTHDLLFPLSALREASGVSPETAVQELSPAEMPEPFRRLLAHDRDMTSTLESFHGEAMALRQLVRELRGEVLYRRVALVGAASGFIAEFGAIAIHLERFGPEPRREILEGSSPLGSILARHRVAYESRPRTFFRLRPGREIAELFDLDGEASPCLYLYGRQNDLLTPAGEPLAEVVEILPPVLEASAG